jgi:SAM-dependent methyltransferase
VCPLSPPRRIGAKASAARAKVRSDEQAGREDAIEDRGPLDEQVFFEIHSGLPREAPGDNASARRALAVLGRLASDSLVLDLGCGPGTATTLLARETGARVVGLDLHAPFLHELQVRARGDAVAARVHAVRADMGRPPFSPAAFDLVWSEGALYNLGFELGLQIARDLLRPGGHLVATEAVWLEAEPPHEIRRWWEGEYPDIASVEEKLEVIAGSDLVTLEHFTLPESAWWEYYRPLERRLEELAERHAGATDALHVLDEARVEVEMYRRFGRVYGYELFVCRRAEPGPEAASSTAM